MIRFLCVFISVFSVLTGQAMAAPLSTYIGFWQQDPSGELIDEDGRHDVDDDLKIQEKWNPEFVVTWYGQDGWWPNWRGGAFKIQGSGSNVRTGNFSILGIDIDLIQGEAEIETEVDYSILHAGAFYTFNWQDIDIEIGATINYLDGEVVADIRPDEVAQLAGVQPEKRTSSTQTVVPTGYLSLGMPLTKKLRLQLHGYGASTGKDSVGQASIAFIANLDAGMNIHLGYRGLAVDFFDENENTGLDINIKGPFAGLSYTWK